jgi:DNA-binding CsgD family transcriptional regulator
VIFGDFIESTHRAQTPMEVFGVLRDAVSAYGFDQLAFGALNNTNHSQIAEDIPAPAVALNYPEEWIHHYFRQGYEKIDPVVLLCPRTTAPLVWEDCQKLPDLTDAQRLLFRESLEVPLRDGVSIPIHGPMGGAYVLSLASSSGKTDFRAHIPMLRAYAYQFFAAYNEASPPRPGEMSLTERESDCLLWSARGKSNWDISVILHISEHTVDFHFRKAMAKLGAGNRIVAIVTAIRHGLIQP